MRRQGFTPGVGIGATLLALSLLSPVARGDETPATGQGAWIGVTTRAQAATGRGGISSTAAGLKVVELAPGGPADQAGIEVGDVLLKIDSRPLKLPTDLTAAESAMVPGRQVEVVLSRGGRTVMTFSMEPGHVPGTGAPVFGNAAAGPAVTGAAAGTSAATGGASAPTGGSAQADTSAPSASSQADNSAPTGTLPPAGAAGVGAMAGAAGTGPDVGANAATGAAGAAAGTGTEVGSGAAAGIGAAAGLVVGAGVAVAASGNGAEPAASGTTATDSLPVPPLATAAAATAPTASEQPADSTDIRSKGSAGLGVRCENLSLDLATALGTKPGQGILVLAVTTGSSADRAGIRPGDVISFAGGEPVVDVDGLDRIIKTANSPLPIVTVRKGTTRVVAAEFPMPPPPEAKASGAQTTEQALESLRGEVKSLREEVRKLREELASQAKGSAVPHP